LPDIPHAYISHRGPGRLRVKIPSRKGDTAYFSELKKLLADCKGTKEYEINPVTGSVLFVREVDIKAVMEFAEGNHLFKFGGRDSPSFSSEITENFKNLNKQLKGITGGGMDIPGLAFLTLLGFGIYQISKGNFTAIPWYAAFWYALNIFLKSQTSKSGG
jgi:Heavy metal associated domain 2